MKGKIAIIGGGVSGMTTAIALQLIGFETVCYVKQLVGNKINENPFFASQYPAASVIPHSVYTEGLEQLFPASQSMFERLHPLHRFHITKHRHYELFEFEKELPAYCADLLKLSVINDGYDEPIPQRKEAEKLRGWSFDCYVAEWPQYIHQLYSYYRQLGGHIQQREIRRDEIASLPAEIVVNCAGVGALELAGDPASAQLIRGHLVHIYNQPLIRNKNDQIVSYNYTPGSSVYSNSGEAADVYFYPINGRWILGGSRQYGSVDEHGSWQGETYEDVININGKEVPRLILTQNSDILGNSFNITPDFSGSNVRVYAGYRFTRQDAEQGLRIEIDEIDDKLIVHNYGHGGAGVTLSWGCSLKVLQYIKQSGAKIPPDNHLKNEADQNKLKPHCKIFTTDISKVNKYLS